MPLPEHTARYPPDERKRRIVAVAAAELEKAPDVDLSLDDIATRAGISRALIYRYFGG